MAARKKKARVPIPADIRRNIYVDAGYRCSVATCTHETGLEFHHIDEDPSNNDESNILLLCAIHHSLATKSDMDRKACREIKRRLRERHAPPAIDHERLACLLAEHLLRTDEWPAPLDLTKLSMEETVARIESEVSGRVEILAKLDDRFVVWTRAGNLSLRQIKSVFLATACLLSGDANTRSLEIGLSNTEALRHTLGGEGIGLWRVRFDMSDVRKVASTKHVARDFWKQPYVLMTAADNLRMSQIQMPFDEFEAGAVS